METFACRNLAGELFHVRRIRRRALAAAACQHDVESQDEQAWIDHCAERRDTQNERIRELLAATDDPHDLLARARALLAGE